MPCKNTHVAKKIGFTFLVKIGFCLETFKNSTTFNLNLIEMETTEPPDA